MSKIIFTEIAWEEYLYWQSQDKKTLKRINLLLQDISRNGSDGIGKPEPLKGDRIVYRISDNQIEVIQCKGHYDDK